MFAGAAPMAPQKTADKCKISNNPQVPELQEFINAIFDKKRKNGEGGIRSF